MVIFLKDYSDIAKKIYGTICEYQNCGWSDAQCDVHHINYQEQHYFEKKIRKDIKENNQNKANESIIQAKEKGFLFFDYKKMQLSKDDRSNNLTVLCPNHHRFVHSIDMGMDILHRIPKRK